MLTPRTAAPAPLHTTLESLRDQHVGDQLAGSRLLLQREVSRADVVPPFAVDLLDEGRRLDVDHVEPESAYEQVAWAFYTGEIEVADTVVVLHELLSKRAA